MRIALLITASVLALLLAGLSPSESIAAEDPRLSAPPAASARTLGKNKDGVIIQRVIKIEGAVEKPRVLFIVPRARLWGGYVLDKSFRSALIEPIYPEELRSRDGTKKTRR